MDTQAHVDVGLSYVIMDVRHAREIPEYAAQHGVTSFKFFPGNAGPEVIFLRTTICDAFMRFCALAMVESAMW